MEQQKLNGRIYDPKTDSYVFPDGSGRITQEQIMERELIKAKLEELQNSNNASPLEIAAYKWAYLFWH